MNVGGAGHSLEDFLPDPEVKCLQKVWVGPMREYSGEVTGKFPGKISKIRELLGEKEDASVDEL